jgi:hypothetical protein
MPSGHGWWLMLPGPGALKDSRPFPCDKLSLEKDAPSSIEKKASGAPKQTGRNSDDDEA